MSISDIIRLCLVGLYLIGWIVYIIIWDVRNKKHDTFKATDWVVQCKLVANLMESGIDLPKEFIIKLLRNQIEKDKLLEVAKCQIEEKKLETATTEKFDKLG